VSNKFIIRDYRDSLSRQLLKQNSYLKKDNFVYVPVWKCASSYYIRLFEHNGWNQIQFQHIDWHNDYVFGFIRDPIERYFKGLVEELFAANIVGAEEFIKQNIDNISNDNHLMFLTHHGMPVSMLHREHISDINWIPLYQAKDWVSSRFKLEYPNDLNIFASDDTKNKIYNFLVDTFGDNSLLLLQLLHDDIKLYEEITQ
jgi:hypothetical protein